MIPAALADVHAAELVAAARWNGAGAVPRPLAVAALAEQRLELRLAGDPALFRATLRRLPAGTARDVADDVTAHRELAVLTPPRPISAFRVGRAAPAATLLRFYREGERRSGVVWQVLAAVNYVESDFGRVRNESVAGAQGPMQFTPSTWRMYGRGTSTIRTRRSWGPRGTCAPPARRPTSAAPSTATTRPAPTSTRSSALPPVSAATGARTSSSTPGS